MDLVQSHEHRDRVNEQVMKDPRSPTWIPNPCHSMPNACSGAGWGVRRGLSPDPLIGLQAGAMDKPCVVYGQKGTGSVPVEAALLLLGEPYEWWSADRLRTGRRATPCSRSLVLALYNGELMTECGHPEDPPRRQPSGRAPGAGPGRPAPARLAALDDLCRFRSMRWSGRATIRAGSPLTRH